MRKLERALPLKHVAKESAAPRLPPQLRDRRTMTRWLFRGEEGKATR